MEAENAKILIVDDDDRNLLALSETVKTLAQVVCVSSGKDALRELLQHEFAVILLDVFMPEMDGYETAAIIRERARTSQVPIIFLSAVNKETSHLMRGYEMGAVDYVFKPVDPVVLKTKVGVFVELYKARQEVKRKAELESSLREAHLREQLDRIEVEQRLEDSERRQASVLATLPMAIYEAAVEGDTLERRFVGGHLDYFLGEKSADLIDGKRRFDEWIHPDDLESFAANDSADDAVTIEYRFVGPDGRKRHLLDQRTRLQTSGSAQQWAGTILDVTDRRELEERLVHAGKLDALGQLTGGVAHDFNNLLASVLGGISILDRRLELGPTEKRVIDQMRYAAEQGTELVKRLTAFSRRQELKPIAIAPRELCEAVAGLVDHTLPDRISTEWHCADTGLNIFADRGQLELALMNLIINARDAMPEGGVIAISMEEPTSAEPKNDTLILRVKDSGVGMTERVLKKVTEPFFTTKETGKGTGLGLSMVAGFVDQSSGKLEIESAPGKGTTISISLPATTRSGDNAHSSRATELSWFEGRRLAVIDDDEGVRIVLSEQLRDIGALVEEFSSGADILEAFDQEKAKFDVVISDFAMPEMNGLETLSRISSVDAEVGKVLMTGNAADCDLTDTADIPLVRKPIDLKALALACSKGAAMVPSPK
jgi:signal transduction histidine kinase